MANTSQGFSFSFLKDKVSYMEMSEIYFQTGEDKQYANIALDHLFTSELKI